jgi:hypothetical protein
MYSYPFASTQTVQYVLYPLKRVTPSRARTSRDRIPPEVVGTPKMASFHDAIHFSQFLTFLHSHLPHTSPSHYSLPRSPGRPSWRGGVLRSLSGATRRYLCDPGWGLCALAISSPGFRRRLADPSGRGLNHSGQCICCIMLNNAACAAYDMHILTSGTSVPVSPCSRVPSPSEGGPRYRT